MGVKEYWEKEKTIVEKELENLINEKNNLLIQLLNKKPTKNRLEQIRKMIRKKEEKLKQIEKKLGGKK